MLGWIDMIIVDAYAGNRFQFAKYLWIYDVIFYFILFFFVANKHENNNQIFFAQNFLLASFIHGVDWKDRSNDQ